MKLILALSLLMIFLTYTGVARAETRNLQNELDRLESLKASRKLTPADKTRLEEIYFLTSRCEDARKLAGQSRTTIGCACGAPCQANTSLDQTLRFRDLLQKSGRWNDPRVRALWSKVKYSPEARYWALKTMRSNPAMYNDANLRVVRADLEQSLDSLEVRR